MKRLIILILIAAYSNITSGQNAESGKNIFKARCSSCHAVKDKVVGPALRDIDKRRSEDWIIKFVHSSQTMVKDQDAYAVKVFADNNKVVMPDHKDLKDADIRDIIFYIKDESAKDDKAAGPVTFISNNNKSPIKFFDYNVWIPFTLSFIFLFIVLFVIVSARSVINNYGAMEAG